MEDSDKILIAKEILGWTVTRKQKFLDGCLHINEFEPYDKHFDKILLRITNTQWELITSNLLKCFAFGLLNFFDIDDQRVGYLLISRHKREIINELLEILKPLDKPLNS